MTAQWTLLASHGTILLYLVNHPAATIREIAAAMDLTERRVSQVLRDLTYSGAIHVHRRGRQNVYELNRDCRIQHPVSEIRIQSLIEMVETACPTPHMSCDSATCSSGRC